MSHGVPALGRRRDPQSSPPIFTPCEELIDDQQTGYCVDPHDPGDLASKLAHLCQHPDIASSLSQNAYAKFSQYTWARTADQYLQVLSGL